MDLLFQKHFRKQKNIWNGKSFWCSSFWWWNRWDNRCFSNFGLFGTVKNTKSVKHNISIVIQVNKKSTKKVKKCKKKFVNNKKTLCWQGSENFKSVIIHFWRILIYNGTFLFPSALSEFRFYCLSLLLSIISWNENLLLHKLDFHIFCKLNRCKTQYIRICLRYWFEIFWSHLQG